MKENDIYIMKIKESVERAKAARNLINSYVESENIILFDSAILQLRKSLECLIYSSVAPNRKEYENFRKSADQSADFTKDYNAKKILQALTKINKQFYPEAVIYDGKKPDGVHHFKINNNAHLTKKKFERIYDRLGKFLHADNPWGNDKGIKNLVTDIPIVIDELFELISHHRVIISSKNFKAVWVVEVKFEDNPVDVRILQAEAI